MDIRTEFIIGNQSEKSRKNFSQWTGVYGYRPEEVINPAELFAVIRISTSTSDIELEKVARILLDELQQVYYEDNESKDNIERLENSVWKMKNRMEVILSREDEIVQSGIDLEMAILVVEKDYVYAAVIGESKIYIKRGNSFVDVSKGLLDGNMMGFLKTGSLKLEENDRMLICTSKASNIALDSLSTTLTQLDIGLVKNLESDEEVAILMLANKDLKWTNSKISKEIILEEKSLDHMEDSNINKEDLSVEESLINNEVNENLDNETLKDAKTIRDERLKRLKMQEETKEIEFEQSKVVNSDDDPVRDIEVKKRVLFIQNLGSNIKGFSEVVKQRVVKLREPKEIDNNAIDDLEIENSDNDTDNKVSKDNKFKLENISIGLKNAWGKTQNARNAVSLKAKKALKNNKSYSVIINNLINRLKKIIISLWQILKREIIGSGDRRSLYLNANRRRRNRYILIIAFVIISIILYSGIRSRQALQKEKDKQETAYSKVVAFQNQLDSMQTQIVDAKGSGDQQKKNDVNLALDNIKNGIDTQKQTGLYVADLNSIQVKIDQYKDSILSITPVTEPQIISDIAKIHPDAVLTGIVFTNNNIYVSDFTRNVIYQLTNSVNAQPSEFITGLNQPYILIKNSSGDMIFYDNDASSGIGKISKDAKISRFANLSAGIIGKIDTAALFKGNDNLYEVHQGNQQIFKRRKIGGGYDQGGALFVNTNPPNWRNDGELTDAIDISIPYEAYVLIKDKGLRRYLAGGDNSLTYANFSNTIQSDYDSIAKATCISANDKYLVVGDPLKSRVMLFSVQGTDQRNLTLISQYVYRGEDKIFKNIKKIIFSDDNTSMFVLDGSKIIKLDIKQ